MTMQLPAQWPVTCHTDHVGSGSTFVAIRGMRYDGVSFIPEAVARGAEHIVIEHNAVVPPDTELLLQKRGVSCIRVPNARRALAELSAQAHGFPGKKCNVIAITGTKGKTTTAWLLEHFLRTAGHKTALLSTVYNRIGSSILPTQLTTDQPDYLHMFFSQCVQAGVEYIVMEVAAQAVSLERVHGLVFNGLIFTNFSAEHAEFYATQADYFAAKCKLLYQLKPEAPVVMNADDEHIQKLIEPKHITFGIECAAMYAAQVESSTSDGVRGSFIVPTGSLPVENCSLIGMYNVYNLLAAIAMADTLGIAQESIAANIRSFSGVPGRLQRYVLSSGAHCYIDYAHNPSSFTAVLSLLKQHYDYLVVVFGAGGQRDVAKRPIMGAIAARYADVVMLTTDNPRDEDPRIIIENILAGIDTTDQSKVIIEVDREKAIRAACSLASSASWSVALLGKGPDEYQLVKGVKTVFSEREIVSRYLQKQEVLGI